MIQDAISSVKRMIFGKEVPMIADAKDISDICFTLIFQRLDKKTLLNCMLTCRRFNDLMSLDSFWVELARYQGVQDAIPSLEWRRAAMTNKFPGNEGGNIDSTKFKFNLKGIVLSDRGYRPISAEEKFIQHFENANNRIFQGTLRTDDFALRAPADGLQMEESGEFCEPHPDVNRCFAFSFSAGSIYTYIDLVASGIDPWILDHVRPKIRITEKVTPRHDCASSLIFAAQLNYHETQWVRENGQQQEAEAVDKPRYKSVHKEWEQWGEATFKDVTLEFDNYPSGMRHLTVLNEGRDGQFWAGFYGPKVANIRIQVILPDHPILRPLEQDTERRAEDDEPEEIHEERRHPRVPLFRRNRGMWGVPPAVLNLPDDEDDE